MMGTARMKTGRMRERYHQMVANVQMGSCRVSHQHLISLVALVVTVDQHLHDRSSNKKGTKSRTTRALSMRFWVSVMLA